MIKQEIFSDVLNIKFDSHIDNRGSFSETYNKTSLLELGINDDFVQDNDSFSKDQNTLRGLHFQLPPFEQSKLLRVVSGSIFDVFVDIRKKSKCYGSYGSITLKSQDGWVYIPKGFAHGFITLTNDTHVLYKVSNYYNKGSELGIRWDDPFFDINWPIKNNKVKVSEKDSNLPFWENIRDTLNS